MLRRKSDMKRFVLIGTVGFMGLCHLRTIRDVDFFTEFECFGLQ